MLLECKHSALVETRSRHRALFEGIRDVRELMAAAYKPDLDLATILAREWSLDLATILGRCMHDILLGLEAGLEGQPIINTGF